MRDGQQHGRLAGPNQRHQVGIDQGRRILGDRPRNDRTVLQQRQEDRARSLAGMQQAIGQRAAHPNRRIIEKTDQRSVERGMLVGRAVMAEIGHRREVRSLPALLAVTRLAEGDEILVRNHQTLRPNRPETTLAAKT